MAQGIRGKFRFIILFAAAIFVAAGSPASAAQYGAIVLDMRDGSVLHESNADLVQSPASLTKMMTLYLTFEAIKNGQISVDQSVRVSSHAASQPPSKLYLKAGQRVTIRSLIRAAAIKSANDAAVALAEAIAGSERAFAVQMTAKARQLGMSRTTFKNANGLTARGHLSTPRDMALLGRHLFFDFPQYYNIFSRKSDRAAGKQIWTTNRLLSSYPGADGIKTGFTNAAGYNLVASAHRGDKRIVAAIFGGRSSRSRNAQMVKLLDKGFARADTRVAMVRPRAVRTLVAEAPVPEPRPGAPESGFEALAGILTSEAQAAVVADSRFAPERAFAPPARPGPSYTAARMPLPVARPAWTVRLGSFKDHEIAVARLNEVLLGDLGSLSNASPVIDEIRSNKGVALYRVSLGGLSRSDATQTCRTLKAGGRTCETVASGG